MTKDTTKFLKTWSIDIFLFQIIIVLQLECKLFTMYGKSSIFW